MNADLEIESMWPRYFLQISYDGTGYSGWQRQKNSHSVQAEIELALNKIIKQSKVITTGCGRTDTGVHARQFYLHFNIEGGLSPEQAQEMMFKLNLMLPRDIGLHALFSVEDKAHTRFDALERSYEYHMHTKRDPFLERFSTYFFRPLNIQAMNEGAEILTSYKDFAAFCKTGGGQKTTLCDLREARWEVIDHRLIFHITADRFLRNMVRAAVGTLVDLGLGRIDVEQFKKIIESGERMKAGTSMPPQGLHLTRVIYPVNTLSQGPLIEMSGSRI
ncbi:MAG: tRNA pseudouridine(38-40) synthase TruA [Flavobacteriales bacterium]